MDVAAIDIRHVQLDENDKFKYIRKSGLNECLSVSANIDQTGRALVQDMAMSMFDEGVVAVVPVKTDIDIRDTDSYTIVELRVAKIVGWYPQQVRVNCYDDETGTHKELLLAKKNVAIIENPLYAVMNEPNSTLKRLLRKLSILDAIDEQSGAGKLDIIIQLPYILKSAAKRELADRRRQDIEDQMRDSQYGIAYIDGTERITQLNRPAENNLMAQVQYLTSTLYRQLGLTEEVFNGTADEKVMLNYMSRTIKPLLNAITEEFYRKFLTKTARTQKQSIMYFRDVFGLAPVNEIATIADRFTRNEILSPNEIRGLIGFIPSEDPAADELRNRNLNQANQESAEKRPSEEDE